MASDLRGTKTDITSICCDLGSAVEIREASSMILKNGTPDVLLNNAGFGVYRPFERSSPEEIDRLLEVNLLGHVRLTKLLLEPMIARGSGTIVFMTSVAGRMPITPNATYCAAKYAMMGLAATLRAELHRFGIGVVAICPGRVDTSFFDHETFRRRTLGVETKGMISADRVAAVTISAIEKNREVTFVPRRLGVISWLYSALPFAIRPIYDRIVSSRMETIYRDEA